MKPGRLTRRAPVVTVLLSITGESIVVQCYDTEALNIIKICIVTFASTILTKIFNPQAPSFREESI